MPKHRFEDLLLEAVDEGLGSLGSSSKEAIYFHLDQSFAIKKQQIPQKIEDFAKALEEIFGVGASFLEISIMQRLHEKIGSTVRYRASENLVFTEYVTAAKHRFLQAKKANTTSQETVECGETPRKR